jgi:transporter family protein
MWVLYALLSAVFAALVSILAKVGLKGINSNLATAIRTFVVLLMAWGIVFLTGKQKDIATLTSKNWRFLIYSGLATGASWLFYFRALQMGEVSKVAPIDKLSVVFTMILAFIFLGETLTLKAIIGGLLIAAGTLVMVL